MDINDQSNIDEEDEGCAMDDSSGVNREDGVSNYTIPLGLWLHRNNIGGGTLAVPRCIHVAPFMPIGNSNDLAWT
jgi:hypothetical protein